MSAGAQATQKATGATGISEVFVFASVDAAGAEKNLLMLVEEVCVPLVTTDARKLPALRQFAKDLAAEYGRPVKLLRFTRREEVEVFEP